MKTILLVTLALASNGFAAQTSNLWQGTGAHFDKEGDQTGEYGVEVTNTLLGEGRERSDIKITLAGGEVRELWMVRSETGNGFTIEGSVGSGGGLCFGEGLCQMYIDLGHDETGTHALAITLVNDGPDQIRMLKTDLLNGQAIGFFREKLTRKQ